MLGRAQQGKQQQPGQQEVAEEEVLPVEGLDLRPVGVKNNFDRQAPAVMLASLCLEEMNIQTAV